MRAVNLIPQDARKGGRQPVGLRLSGSSAGPYVLLAALAVAVVLAGAWALSSKQLSEHKAELARVQQEAQAAEAKSASLASYKDFATLSAARAETVSGLIKGRFDWSHGLREVARVIPADVNLLSLVGTTSPTSTVQGGGGSLRGALPLPAIDLIGCAKSQSRVAQLLARLRAIDGVQRVSLSSSEKTDSASLSDSDCRASSKMPQFQITVFFKAQPGIAPVAAAIPAAAPATTSAGGTK